MSLNSKQKRDARKKKEQADLQKKKTHQTSFYVAVDAKSGQPLAFETTGGIVSTYAAVGKPNVIGQLKSAIKEQQGEDVKVVPLSRANFYMGALMKLPALGLDLMLLIGPAGQEVIPMSVRGQMWMQENRYPVADIEDPMEIMLYSAQRIATLEFNRPFRTLADVSEAIPTAVIDLMESVIKSAPPPEPADTSALAEDLLN